MKRHLQQGFTLIEAMIAVLVLSIGLLGIASIQMLSLRNSVGSYGRSQATLAAYDIIDRMRANMPGVRANNYLLDPATPPANPNINSNCTTGNGCTVAQMAQTDLALWLGSLSVRGNATTPGYDLPGGNARITCSANPCVAGSTVTVTVMWDEQRTGAVGTACSSNLNIDLTCFEMRVGI